MRSLVPWQGTDQILTTRAVRLAAEMPIRISHGAAQRRRSRVTASYSNAGYILLGLIIEAATGNPLDQELDRWFFGPLGLRASLCV